MWFYRCSAGGTVAKKKKNKKIKGLRITGREQAGVKVQCPGLLLLLLETLSSLTATPPEGVAVTSLTPPPAIAFCLLPKQAEEEPEDVHHRPSLLVHTDVAGSHQALHQVRAPPLPLSAGAVKPRPLDFGQCREGTIKLERAHVAHVTASRTRDLSNPLCRVQ